MVRWIKDEQAEAAMMEMSLRFQVRAIDAGEIDEKASLQNRGRDKQLDQRNAEAIGRGATSGTPVHMIVVAQMKCGKYRILSGNHRFFGLKDIGETRFDVYIVSCDDFEFGQLAFQLNTNHGMPIDEKARMERAIEFVQDGMTHDEAGRRTGLSRSAVGAAIRTNQAYTYIASVLPSQTTKKIQKRVAEKLKQLKDDELVKMLAPFASGPASEDEKWRAIKLIAEETSRDKRVDMIASTIPAKVGGVSRPVRVSFLRSLAQMENMLDRYASYAGLQIEQETIEGTKKRVAELVKKLKGLVDG